MKSITRFVLKRPVTMIMAVLCLIYFGLSSVLGMPMELSPETEMPILMVMTAYPGASPEDVSELVTKELEEEAGSLSGVKTVGSTSSENISVVTLQYEYGTDIDEAYDDLKKKVDLVAADLPADAQTPVIMEMDSEAQADITLAIDHLTMENLYSYVEGDLVPEFEKIPAAADVSLQGGREEYVKIELIQEKVSQYSVSMASIAADIQTADLSYPAGDTRVGNQNLAVSTRMNYDTVELLKQIPLTTGGGGTVYLEDVAKVHTSSKERDSIARYQGEDTISLAVTKQQSVTAVELSEQVRETVDALLARDSDLRISIINDSADSIRRSLSSAAFSLFLAVVIAMIIIWLFFGELKASLIVGSSIPLSILATLILMSRMGFSLNMITLNSLVLGVGMMVDNSIVVLESCFRMSEGKEGGFLEYREHALEGTGTVAASIMGGTATTCVVFLPLAFMKGMSAQVFGPLAYTIVFCMVASLLSAITIVPLCYMTYKPVERKKAPLSGLMEELQDSYRKLMSGLLNKKKTVMAVTFGLLIFSFFLASRLDVELMGSDDQGEIEITVNIRPGLITDKIDDILKQVETVIADDPNLESYLTSYGGSMLSDTTSATVYAYLTDDRDRETAEVARQWRQELSGIKNCSITVETAASMAMMTIETGDYEVILEGADYDNVKQAADEITRQLKKRKDVTKIHSDAENASPTVEIRVDALKSRAAGFNAAQIGAAVRNVVSGVEATEIEVDGEELSVKVEYADGEYDTIDQIRGIMLPAAGGGSVALTDLAQVLYVDSPASVSRKDKQYTITISGSYTDLAGKNTEKEIMDEIVIPNLTEGVTIGTNSQDTALGEEFASLFSAIATAVFLVFVVMAAQFESPKYSLMVMTTIPFSLIGAFGLLFLTGCSISMVSLIGFLILIGTVVNNGILFVDTANQYRETMDMNTALVEAGATRIRPMLMTSLTTIIAMIPVAMALGDAGNMTQGLAIVDIGGMTASTILALLMLPAYYKVMSYK